MSEECVTGEARQPSTPRIYVASLADYNAGRLHGRWIDADQPAEVIREEIAMMLADSCELVAEEWAIHDYENFGALSLSEFEDVEHVAQVGRLLVKYGPAFAGLVSHFGGAPAVDEAASYMEERYRGAFDSLADFAQELVEDYWADLLRELPDFIKYHIDYEGIGRELELSGDVLTIESEHKIHIFTSCL